jgi:hypothetical protein
MDRENGGRPRIDRHQAKRCRVCNRLRLGVLATAIIAQFCRMIQEPRVIDAVVAEWWQTGSYPSEARRIPVGWSTSFLPDNPSKPSVLVTFPEGGKIYAHVA